MQFEYSEKSQELIDKVDRFMRDNLYPVEQALQHSIDTAETDGQSRHYLKN